MTREQYHTIVENYEQHRIDLEVAQLSRRLNPTGKLYRQKIKEIINKYENHP